MSFLRWLGCTGAGSIYSEKTNLLLLTACFTYGKILGKNNMEAGPIYSEK